MQINHREDEFIDNFESRQSGQISEEEFVDEYESRQSGQVSEEEFIDNYESRQSGQVSEEEFVDYFESRQSGVVSNEDDNTRAVNAQADNTIEQTPSDLRAMLRIADYYIPLGARPIGAGHQASVYPCKRMGRPNENYVVKVYNPDLKHPDYIQQVIDLENRIAGISSPNLVRNLYCGNTDDGRFAVVMPRYERINRRNNPVNFGVHGNEEGYIKSFVKAVEDLNKGMKALHNNPDKQIIHSDIKPGNILFRRDKSGFPIFVIIDVGGGIGADRKRNDKSMQTGNGNLFTMGYVAEECMRGRNVKGNEYSDMYSAGVSLAEYLVGFYPYAEDLKAESNDPEKMHYYSLNSGKGEKRAGRFLLPKNLPDCIFRFFQGTLYLIPSDKDSNDDRWGHKKVDEWIALMRQGKYKEAASIKDITNAPIVQPSQNSKVRAVISFDDMREPEIVYSAEEMVDRFLDKNRMSWVIGKIRSNDKAFIESFRKLDPSIVSVMQSASKKMQNKSFAELESIFISNIVDVYGSEETKNKLIHGGMIFDDKVKLGEKMYSCLKTAMEKGSYKSLKKCNEIRKLKNPDAFTRMLLLFEDNFLSRFFTLGKAGWTIDDDNMNRIRLWEKRMNSDNPGDTENLGRDLVELFRLAFYLQDMVILHIDKLPAFTNAASLTGYINQLGKKNPIDAIDFYSKLYTNNDTRMSFKPQVYAWMMDADGFNNRPGVGMMPGCDGEVF